MNLLRWPTALKTHFVLGFRQDWLAATLLLLSWLLFVAGVVLPMFTVNAFVFFGDSFSLLSGIVQLIKEQELLLGSAVFLFSVMGPIYKLYLCQHLLVTSDLAEATRLRRIKRLALISKWSMADVFVVSITASVVKFGLVANVTIHAGLLVFAAAVISSMLLVQRLLADYELRPKSETQR